MNLDGFSDFCGELALENRRRMILEDFQREMLSDYFDGITESLILIPKKNGKTTLLAALALYHLIESEDANVAIGASSRDQAMVLFEQARGFIRRTPLPQVRALHGYREIRRVDPEDPENPKRWTGLIKVYAADADRVDGWIGTLALVDELHRHKTGALYQVFRDGLGPRGGQMITISTAGDDEDTPLGQLRQKAHQLPGVKLEGHHRHAHTPEFALHEWSLGPDEDRSDMELVADANPASWQDAKALAKRFDSPSMQPWEWARFACGVWLTGEDTWLDAGMWEECAEEDAEIPEGAPVFVGVDIGIKKDSSAVVTCWRREDERVVVKAQVFTPGGDPLDLSLIEEAIRDIASYHQVMGVVYDRWSFERSAQMLSDEGLLMIEFPMTNERTVPATARLYEAIRSHTIVHDGDPVLAAHVNAGGLKATERGNRLTKAKNKKPIDALMALMVAFTQADQVPTGGGFEW